MTDMILGAVTNYTYAQIEPWLVSIKRTGFTGTIGLIVYNMDHKDVELLEKHGVSIFAFSREANGDLKYPTNDGFNIVVERFIHAWYFLKEMDEKPDYVVMTDVRDVVFQKDPFQNELYMGAVVLGSENFRYKDEPWSKNNMIQAFGPVIFDKVKDYEIYCAGVIGGDYEVFMDLCLNTYLLCRGTPAYVPGGGGPDQAALNITISQLPWSLNTQYLGLGSDWAVHIGTSSQAIEQGSGEVGAQYLRNKIPYKDNFVNQGEISWDEEGTVYNPNGQPYTIVHQYNRIRELNAIIDKRYRD